MFVLWLGLLLEARLHNFLRCQAVVEHRSTAFGLSVLEHGHKAENEANKMLIGYK